MTRGFYEPIGADIDQTSFGFEDLLDRARVGEVKLVSTPEIIKEHPFGQPFTLKAGEIQGYEYYWERLPLISTKLFDLPSGTYEIIYKGPGAVKYHGEDGVKLGNTGRKHEMTLVTRLESGRIFGWVDAFE